MRVLLIWFGVMMLCLTFPCYGQGYKGLENLALKASVEAEGSDIPVENVKDGNFTTRWNAKNDDVDTWVQFTWNATQKINRVHITEFRSRVRGHTIEYGDSLSPVENLKMIPENADASANHPTNQQAPVEIPDHILTFKTVKTNKLRYHVTKTVDATSEPSLWEIEIFYDPELDASPVQYQDKLAVAWGQIKNKQ